MENDQSKIPKNLSLVQLSSDAMNLKWDHPINIGGISGYNLYSAFTNDLDYELFATTTGLNYIITGLEINRQYYFSVTSVYSGIYPFADDLNYMPNKPSAHNLSGNLLITWESPINQVSSYRLWRTNKWGAEFTALAITTGLNYIDSGLDSTLPYYYRITSIY